MIELWTDGSASPNPGPGGFAVIEMVNGSAKPVVLGVNQANHQGRPLSVAKKLKNRQKK